MRNFARWLVDSLGNRFTASDFVKHSEIPIAETAWLSTTGNDGTAQLGNPAKKYQTVAAAITAGAKQLVLEPGTFEFVGTEITAYVRGVGSGRSFLNITKTGTVGANGTPGLDNEDGDGGNGNPGENGESLTLDINIVSDRSAGIGLNFAGGLGGEGGPGGMGSTLVQGNPGDNGDQGLVEGAIILTGCIVNSLSAERLGLLTVAVEDCNVTTTHPELVTSFASSLVNGANPEIAATVAAANNAYLRLATGGTVSGPIVSSGANGKIGLPILTTAQRAAQSGRANGDLFIDNATQRAMIRINGVDRFTLAAEPISDYLGYLAAARCVRELHFISLAGYVSNVLTGSGSSGTTGWGRQTSSGATANSTARMILNSGVINNAGLAWHSVPNVDGRLVPFSRPVFITFWLNYQSWRGLNVNNPMTTTGGGVFTRCYWGCANTGSNYTLNTRGIGIHINDQRQVSLVAHNGTTLTQSGTLASCPTSTAGSIAHEFTVFSDGLGNVTLFQNGIVLGAITGGPTANATTGTSGISVEVGNGTDALATTVATERVVIGVL